MGLEVEKYKDELNKADITAFDLIDYLELNINNTKTKINKATIELDGYAKQASESFTHGETSRESTKDLIERKKQEIKELKESATPDKIMGRMKRDEIFEKINILQKGLKKLTAPSQTTSSTQNQGSNKMRMR